MSPAPPKPAAKKTAAKAPTKRTSSRSDLVLDSADPHDAQIIARQVAAARQAGASGGDRAGLDQSRPDLLAAFDQGAAGTKPGLGARAGQAAAKAGKGAAKGSAKAAKGSAGFLSKGSWKPTLKPGRARDAGGLLAGMFLYTGVSVYIRYGPEGWKGWLSAKFLNKPLQGLPKAASTSKGTTS